MQTNFASLLLPPFSSPPPNYQPISLVATRASDQTLFFKQRETDKTRKSGSIEKERVSSTTTYFILKRSNHHIYIASAMTNEEEQVSRIEGETSVVNHASVTVVSGYNNSNNDIYLLKPIQRPPECITGEVNLLEKFNMLKILRDFNSKHLSSTYKSYVRNLPGDNYIRREKSHSSSSSHQSNNIAANQQHPTPPTPNSITSPPQQQQQQQPDGSISSPSTQSINGLSKLVEQENYYDDQQELILLSLGESQLKSAFTLQDGGYIRPDKDKKKHRHDKKKKKRKHRDDPQNGSGSGGMFPVSLSTNMNADGNMEHKKKKKRRDRDDNITVEH
ncbi:putative mediator complex subunit 19 [Cavenderia fasciculata]|uniref:Mediator complex subunit 19 n=1 Tax=Cavenderia fasciculata TaxID=261658 RepID=F4PL45_CACFS|nr:putative mediator complex subunit 19 [Cavenderia fasciculata]EGG23267.1 putative mediator complex subunit 19 [Cavenderia fasciculata]|eukprot:XP_004361118.1 putative mediator complex subunit 19 [Cavenderia fasciculata]